MLELNHITFTYPKAKTKCLDDISLRLAEGEITGLIGATGAGKSTLAMHLNGLLQADCGDVILDGKILTDKKEDVLLWRKEVGLVFQYPENQFFADTVKEEILFAARNHSFSDDECEELLDGILGRFDFLNEADLDKSPFEFSGGQKRFIAIASILITQPKYLILDEPTVGLDNFYKEKLLKILISLKSQNTGILIISHDLEFLSLATDKIIILDKGKITAFGKSKEILSDKKLLESHNLFLPEITEIMYKLKSLGWNVPLQIFSIKEATQEILTHITQKTFSHE